MNPSIRSRPSAGLVRPLTAVAGAMVLALVCGCSSENVTFPSLPFPHNLQHRVILKQDGKGRLRFVTLSADGSRVSFVRVETAGGMTVLETYRHDATLEKREEYYPPQEGVADTSPANLEARKLRSTALYDHDGTTLLYLRVVAEDGTPIQDARRRGNGELETEFYFADGKLQMHVVEDERGRLVSSQRFLETGKLAESVERLSDGRLERTLYRDSDGSRSYTVTAGLRDYDPMEQVVYGADGKTVTMKASYTSTTMTLTYYRADGTVDKVVESSRYGSVSVTVYGADGKKRFKQSFVRKGSVSDPRDIKDVRLDSIEEYDAGGDRTRRIELWDDGKTPKEIFAPDGTNYWSGKYRHFRKDGTLEKEEEKENYNKVKDSKDFTPEDNIREDLPPEYLDAPPAEAPPRLSALPVPRPRPEGCCCGEECQCPDGECPSCCEG